MNTSQKPRFNKEIQKLLIMYLKEKYVFVVLCIFSGKIKKNNIREKSFFVIFDLFFGNCGDL